MYTENETIRKITVKEMVIVVDNVAYTVVICAREICVYTDNFTVTETAALIVVINKMV